MYIGLITSKSNNQNEWRYVKFNWGSREMAAKATLIGENKWSYSISNIRKFFGATDDDKIFSLPCYLGLAPASIFSVKCLEIRMAVICTFEPQMKT